MNNDHDLKCPVCGQTMRFAIGAHHTATINGHDVESDGANLWDDESSITCLECMHGGAVGDFYDGE